MFLWLDDLRKSPESWTWAKTCEEAIELIKNNDITDMSLDHDLSDPLLCEGGYNSSPELTGFDFVCFMISNLPPSKWPTNINVHSMNGIAANRMIKMLEDYAPRNVKIKRVAFHDHMIIKNGEVIR